MKLRFVIEKALRENQAGRIKMKMDKKLAILDNIFACLLNTAHQFEVDNWGFIRITFARLVDSTNLSSHDLIKILSEAILISQRFNAASDEIATPGQMGRA